MFHLQAHAHFEFKVLAHKNIVLCWSQCGFFQKISTVFSWLVLFTRIYEGRNLLKMFDEDAFDAFSDEPLQDRDVVGVGNNVAKVGESVFRPFRLFLLLFPSIVSHS